MVYCFQKIEKQPTEVLYKKLFYKKQRNIYSANRKTPALESLFNSEYWKIFKSTYIKEHLQTVGSETVFVHKTQKYSSGVLTLHLKKGFFSIYIRNKWKCFLSHDWFPMHFVFTFNISLLWWEINPANTKSLLVLIKRRLKLQEKIRHVNVL